MDPDDDFAARQSRWGSLAAALEAQCMEEDDSDDEPPRAQAEPGRRPPVIRTQPQQRRRQQQQQQQQQQSIGNLGFARSASFSADNGPGDGPPIMFPAPMQQGVQRQRSLPPEALFSGTAALAFPAACNDPSTTQLSADNNAASLYGNTTSDERLAQMERNNLHYHHFQQQNNDGGFYMPQMMQNQHQARAQQQQQQQQQRRQQQQQQCQYLPDLFQQFQNSTSTMTMNARSASTLREWIATNKVQSALPPNNAASANNNTCPVKKQYLEKAVKIAHFIACKLLECSEAKKKRGDAGIMEYGECEPCDPRPEDLDEDCIIVKADQDTGDIEGIHFDTLQNFDWAMDDTLEDTNPSLDLDKMFDALGRLFFNLFTQGEKAPPLDGMRSSMNGGENETEALSDENAILALLRGLDESGAQEDGEKDKIYSLMKAGNATPPLCRLVSDLLQSCSSNNFGRMNQSSTIFTSLTDVCSDLKQMIDYPDEFLFGTVNSRWELVFGGNRLFGRKDELEIILNAAHRLQNSAGNQGSNQSNLPVQQRAQARNKKEVVMLCGRAGSGKSRLIYEARKPLVADGWLFLRCKFEKAIHSEPLSVISMAFDEYFSSTSLCGQHMPSWQEMSLNASPNPCSCNDLGCPRKICHQLESKLGLESLTSLAQQMPNLRNLINQMYPSQRFFSLPGDGELSLATPVQKYRTHYFFATILDTLSSSYKVILFADDLQWADESSLELFTGLLCQGSDNFNSSTASSLFFIGAYREVEAECSLMKLFQTIQTSETMNITRIVLGGVSMESLNEIVSEALCLPMRKTRPLSQIIFQKTQGYPLFVVEFLDVLLTENLISHNVESGWEWNIDAIDLKEISISVAELLSSKLQRLPRDVLSGLQLLSCFGSHVDAHIINTVKSHDATAGPMIMAALEKAQTEGLVDCAGPTLTFTHNMIQQAAFDLIPSSQRSQLLMRLASSFMSQYQEPSAADSTLFVAVDLINRIGPDAVCSNIDQSITFAKLNLDAGKKAMDITDFASAVRYFDSGISFLQGNHWVDHYELSLGLFENAAAANYCNGNHDAVVTQANVVLDHARSFEDKFKSHCVYVNVIALGSMKDAMDKLYYLLNYLGGNVDPKKVTTSIFSTELKSVKEILKGEQKLNILHSCRMTDRTKLMKMKVMAVLIRYYNRKRSFMSGYLACQMLRMSWEHGHCEDTAFALALLAYTVSNVLNDATEACSLARASLSLSKMYGSDDLIPRIYAIIFGLVLIVEEPIQSSLDPLLKACRLSFVRSVENTMWNTYLYVARSFHCGKNLTVLSNELKAFGRQHKLLNQMDVVSLYLAPAYRLVSSLNGMSLDTSDDLSKSARECSVESALETAKFNDQDIYTHGILALWLAESFYQRKILDAAQFIQKHNFCFQNEGQHKFNIAEFDSVFHCGLVAYHMARETREQHWMEKGNAALTAFEAWSKQCQWNFESRYLILLAEFHNSRKEKELAVRAYDASVISAERHRFLHLEALACELASYYFGSIPEAKKRTREMVQKSHDLYLKWGATKKATMVKLAFDPLDSWR